MSKIQKLTKVLEVREREKKDAQIAHHQSIKTFEDIAVKLYELLKKKESAEVSYEEYIQKTMTIDIIRDQMNFIESLNDRIVQLQQQVKSARNQMEIKQVELTDAHVEVKKFEKVIEFRKKEQKKIAHKEEQILMDEISTQQYLTRKTGE